MVVGVLVAGQFAPENDGATQLLTDFANKGLSGILIGFNFPSGKFPLAAEMFMVRPLGQQDPPFVFNQGADYRDWLGFGIYCHVWN